jgi:TonB-linked SusC/RagA family outer membrane protein
MKKVALLFSFLCMLASSSYGQGQNILVTGTVSDEDGASLPGVSILVKGTSLGVAGNSDGEFSIRVPSESSVLVFTLLGFSKQEVQVKQRRTFAIVLKEEASELGEVTVVAFGKQKKESVIASVEAVNVKDLRVSSANLTTSFAGRIPGLISYQTSGEPGADNAKFFVRGVTTFGYKQDPLILIDGFEATSDDLARIQPDDIEGFSILKDASATVLYGARGANGIILVTTRSGQEAPARLSFRVDVNTASPTRMLELLDGVSYMRLYNEARVSRNPVLAPYYSEEKIQATARGDNPMIYPNIDWYDELFKTYTLNTKVNMNIEGGGKAATYYVAGGYDHETGLLKVDNLNNFNNNIDINRFHLRSNAIFKPTSTTRLDTRVQGRFERYNGPYFGAGDIFKMVLNGNPVDFPAVWAPDQLHQYTTHTLFGNLLSEDKANPYAEMVKGYNDQSESTLNIQATLLQDFDFLVKGLKAQLKASANTWNIYAGRRQFQPSYYALWSLDDVTGEYVLKNTNPGANPRLGDVEPSRNSSSHFYYEARLNWDRQFGKHSLGLMTVGIAEEHLLTAGESNDIYETLPERNLGNSGRLTYDYDTRYFFEFGYGYNGSEKFSGDRRFGFFPSVGFGWLVSNESFWQEYKNAVSLLKFKFTAGKVGNDAIAGRSGRFFYLSNIVNGGGNYQWGNGFSDRHSGYSVLRYGNPDITWEVSTKYNLGMELGFFRDEALKFQIDFFRDIRDKIYMARENYPATAGFEAGISGNVGKVAAKGIDTSLDYKQFFNKNFWLTGRANFTYSTNKIVEIDEKNYTDEYLKRIGHNINQSWGLVAERLFVDDLEVANSPEQSFGSYMAGDIKYRDINGDGVINGNDRIAMGYPLVPEIQYGFGLSAGYKNLDLSFFFQGNARVSFYVDPEKIAPLVNRRNAPAIIADNAWSVENPDVHALWPRLSPTQIDNNNQESSWWLRDGSFLRLKTIECGYNVPKSITKVHIANCRIYVSAENLFVLSAFDLWDPEMGGNGLGYPLNRRFNVGAQVSF